MKVATGLHEFLTERFGDYMVLPDKESIKRSQHAVEWQADIPLVEFSNKHFSDEKKLV